MTEIFFHGWPSVLRVALMTGVTYLLVVGALRVFGAQALAKMSGYDLVVTITVGSLLANIALSSTFSVSDGLGAILTLLLLQELTRRLQKRFVAVHHAVRVRPRMLMWNGRFVRANLDALHVTDDEVRAAIRRSGLLALSQVQAVVLENDGEWSVMPRSAAPDLSALHGIDVPGRSDEGRADGSDDRWPPGEAPAEAGASGAPPAGTVTPTQTGAA